MDYSIQINAVNKEDSSIKGFATVVFGGSFKVGNVAIMENSEGKLFVSMPRYRSSERTEHNQAVYKDICNPITKEFRQELYDNILELYGAMKEQEKKSLVTEKTDAAKENGEKMQVPDFSVRVTPMQRESGSLLGMAGICFENSFAVNNIRILQGKDDIFIAMPSVKTGKTGENNKAVYQDICYPVTKEFREELYQRITDSYRQEVAAIVSFKEAQSQKESRQEAETQEMPQKKRKAASR